MMTKDKLNLRYLSDKKDVIYYTGIDNSNTYERESNVLYETTSGTREVIDMRTTRVRVAVFGDPVHDNTREE